MQVTRSTGKHTNAVLCCLSWFNEKLHNYVVDRRMCVNEEEKIEFFNAMRQSVTDGSNRLELLQFGHLTRPLLSSNEPLVTQYYHTRNFADVVLVALSKNQKRVNAVAANYRTRVTPLLTQQQRRKRPRANDDTHSESVTDAL